MELEKKLLNELKEKKTFAMELGKKNYFCD